MDIKKSINKFLEGNGKNKGRKANERYASFDFCYNYFYSFYILNFYNILFHYLNHIFQNDEILHSIFHLMIL